MLRTLGWFSRRGAVAHSLEICANIFLQRMTCGLHWLQIQILDLGTLNAWGHYAPTFWLSPDYPVLPVHRCGELPRGYQPRHSRLPGAERGELRDRAVVA